MNILLLATCAHFYFLASSENFCLVYAARDDMGMYTVRIILVRRIILVVLVLLM
jgi:hypothetical protein